MAEKHQEKKIHFAFAGIYLGVRLNTDLRLDIESSKP